MIKELKEFLKIEDLKSNIININELNMNKCLKFLSNEELCEFNCKRNFKNKKQFLAGRISAKIALKEKLSQDFDYKKVEIYKNNDGAPFFKQFDNINLSITHSNEYCISVVSNKKIGIDLEQIEFGNSSIVNYFFSNEEIHEINLLNDNEKNKKIIEIWTLKESISKFYRLGMRMNYQELNSLKESNEFKIYKFINDKISCSVILER